MVQHDLELLIQSLGTVVQFVDVSHFLFTFPVVPEPNVTVYFDSTTPFYAGSSLTLVCMIELSLAVDTAVTVNTTWSRSGEELWIFNHTSVSQTTQSSAIEYQSTITLAPLSQTLDNGLYSCEVTVSDYTSASILDATTLSSRSVIVQSKCNLLRPWW